MKGDSGNGAFLGELRRALYHLYDPAELRRSSLLDLFGIGQTGDAAASLRCVLMEAIESLKPGADVPSHAKAWRIYHVLFQRYSEQFTQREVATDLGLSIRQLRRQERVALRVLADHLRNQYKTQATDAASRTPPADEDTPSREQELEWLRESLPSESVELAEVCQAVLKTVAPLTQNLRVRIESTIPQDLPRLAVQLPTMRQALLNVVTAAVRCVPGGRVEVSARAHRLQVYVNVCPVRRHPASGSSLDDDMESLEMARQLISLSGGSMNVRPGDDGCRPFSVRLVLLAAGQIPVLVIDDNSDTLQLLERYLVGSHYRFIGVPDPQRALTAAERLSPQIIVLDVMLPNVDGWELLGRLREHPKTRGVPIIVCTILPQEQLALSLGAAAFIRKPVSRRIFRSTLDRQVELLLRESG